MSEARLQQVKNSLKKEHYTMNDSWLSDCVDYYLDDHVNPTNDEISAFVMNQFTLYDMRETNNENGCLPRNLANQKCTTLPGKYILQVDKMYDISTSKYKQLEKIRNVSSENIEATENENKTQEDKFQTWEPKSKRMLQLYLTDGVQDVSGIEYKAIRFKKDVLPGYKLMIKGPVICRKGVILLEDKNVVEVGGEVDSLLIKNALENVLARALNLDENPDPYNDKNRQKQNTQSTQKTTTQIDDDFDLDSQVIDQIDKQIQQQDTNALKNSATSNLSSKQSLSSKISEFNYSYQAPSTSSKSQKSDTSARNQVLSSRSTSNKQQTNNEKMIVDFDDEGDSFLEMVDDSAFKTPSISMISTVKSKVTTTKEVVSTKSRDDEFPADDEVYDLTEPHSPFFSSSKPKSQSTTTKAASQKKDSCGITTSSPKSTYNEKRLNADRESSTSKVDLKENPSIASSYRSTSKVLSKNKITSLATPSVSNIDDFHDNLDLNDIDMDGFDDYFDKNEKNNLKNTKSSQASTSNSPNGKNALLRHTPLQHNTNSTASSNSTGFQNEFEPKFYEEFKNKLLTPQKPSQPPEKSVSTSKNEQSVTASTSSLVSKNSSAKLSDKLKFENKNKDYYNTHDKMQPKHSRADQMSTGSLFKSKTTDAASEHSAFQTNKSPTNYTKSESKYTYENLDADFENEFQVEFEATMEVDSKPVMPQIEKNKLKMGTEKSAGHSTTKSQDSVASNSDIKSSGFKRTASPSTSSRQKLRCVESTPKNKTNSRKITDFFNKPKPQLLYDLAPLPLYEAISDVLEQLQEEEDKFRSLVRGKVTNVVKLNLLKGENGSYFHLEGTITDGTANLDIVFSSDVLEGIVGYSTEDFILKRKRAKSDPKIKDELREDLSKAQQTLRKLDALMEIEVKKNEKAIIVGIRPLTKKDKELVDERLRRYKAEKKNLK